MNPSETIGQYRLIQKLGAGAFGEVWKAEHVELGWVRAVKIPRSPEVSARLREEGQIAAKLEALRHPNIVQIHDLNTSGETPYVVFEYVAGEDLATRLRREPMSVEEVTRLSVQMLQGLAAAHEQGIVHRDIKPSNVLLSTDGTVKIADFGLGRIVEDNSLAWNEASLRDGRAGLYLSQVSRSEAGPGEVVGTLAYMSPEQRRGEEATPASDLYSVGVVIYEALTGALPEGRFDLPGQIVQGVPRELDLLLDNLLRPLPERRGTSTAALERLLRSRRQVEAIRDAASEWQPSQQKKGLPPAEDRWLDKSRQPRSRSHTEGPVPSMPSSNSGRRLTDSGQGRGACAAEKTLSAAKTDWDAVIPSLPEGVLLSDPVGEAYNAEYDQVKEPHRKADAYRAWDRWATAIWLVLVACLVFWRGSY